MSKVIPKEQLTAYQRWELATFEEGAVGARLSAANFAPPPEPPPETVEDAVGVVLPTAEDLERIQQAAWQEGYNLGLEEGRKAGFDAGSQEGEAYVRRLRALAECLDVERLRQDEALARELLAVALAVARQVVRVAIAVKPALILEAIKEAFLSLPALNGHHKIATHPDHVELVRDWLAREHGHLSWKVVGDDSLQPGGFRFESAHSELDGSLETRWREIADCLGADPDWLA